ncbi:DUF5895 domain-containing protein [Microseira sp. BLCC-F43]|jgi:hypothetical protein|uniref:DUF5895 domain-containing protein n=1 Tax=Microseira sp. BLCC-F43 TaxID=3153602 RepID=UPI0035B89D4D
MKPKQKTELTEITETTALTGESEMSNTINEEITSEFEIDPELLGEEFNAPRIPRLPYAIVINDNPAGIFIPEKNLVKAVWIGEQEIVEFELPSGKEKGIFLSQVRMVILGCVRPYIRYKSADELGDLALSAIGWYDENKHLLEKKTMDAVSEHLVVFLSDRNEPLHQRPIRIRFKNVALWSIKEALDEFYSAIELVFAKFTSSRASGKSDRWRSLCVFACEFKAVKEGEGSNKSYCCKVGSYVQPTVENFTSLFLGSKHQKDTIWELFDMNSSFAMLTAVPDEPIKSALPPGEEPQLLPPAKSSLLKPKH